MRDFNEPISGKKLKLYLAGGEFNIKTVGVFAEDIRKVIHAAVRTDFDDDGICLDLIETGDFKEESLTFTRKRVEVKSIYDSELFSHDQQSYKDMAITHFTMNNLQKMLFKQKTKVAVNGDVGLNELQDASIKWAEQNGKDGTLLILDRNTVLLVDPDDFELHMIEVIKRGRPTICGAVFCSKPHKVIRIGFTGKLVLT